MKMWAERQIDRGVKESQIGWSTVFVGESLGFFLQLNSFLVDLHDALKRRLLAGGHLARQVVDVYVLRDGNFSVADSW